MSIREFLTATEVEFAKAVESKALEHVSEVFAEPEWGVKPTSKPFAESNYGNIWNNELSQTVRATLADEGVNKLHLQAWLGEVQYHSLEIYNARLFGDVGGYRSNTGWRILILSFPYVGVACAGIASHYQQGQNHNQLAKASNFLHEHAKTVLGRQGKELPGRPVGRGDWDGHGLVEGGIKVIAGVDLSGLHDGKGARFGDLRTTTVKKILASYVSIEALSLDRVDDGDLMEYLEKLRDAGSSLGGRGA